MDEVEQISLAAGVTGLDPLHGAPPRRNQRGDVRDGMPTPRSLFPGSTVAPCQILAPHSDWEAHVLRNQHDDADSRSRRSHDRETIEIE